tara:strand:- start:10340 stop:10645 length:306 start_codon:yes stop_codon:yes gene_type:complete
MRNGLAEVTATFDQFFNVAQLEEQYATVKNDILEIGAAFDGRTDKIQVIKTPIGISIYHAFNGEEVVERYTDGALKNSDITAMKVLRSLLGAELSKLNKAA